MDGSENTFPMDITDPSSRPWNFRPEGYLVVILAGTEEAERAHLAAVAVGDERAGADKAAAADDRVVEDDRADADEGSVADGAAVQHGLVPDGDVLAEGERDARIGVQDRGVLRVPSVNRLKHDLVPVVVVPSVNRLGKHCYAASTTP